MPLKPYRLIKWRRRLLQQCVRSSSYLHHQKLWRLIHIVRYMQIMKLAQFSSIYPQHIRLSQSFSFQGSSYVSKGLLEYLKGYCKYNWCDHHADSEDNVLWEFNGSMGDISPREFIDIWRGFRYGHEVCCEDTSESEDESY